MKINKINKINTKKTSMLGILVIGVIFILVNTSYANSYLISESFTFSGGPQINDGAEFLEGIIHSGLNLLVAFFTIKQFGTVSAASEVSMGCCKVAVAPEGGICVEMSSLVKDEKCENGEYIADKTCEEVSVCEPVCCVGPVEGMCSTQSPLSKCDADGGEYKDEGATENYDPFCEIERCQRGCCILGDTYEFLNPQECAHRGNVDGINEEFRSDLRTSAECFDLRLQTINSKGACIINDVRCEYLTYTQCQTKPGIFFENTYCTNSQLENDYGYDYIEGDGTTCVEGIRDKVFNIDSEGNLEDSFPCDPEDFCYEEIYGQASCEYSGCSGPKVIDFDERHGRAPRQGESWCIYDGYVGEGKDPVGSAHYYAKCNDGEAKITGLGDYRKQICTESKIELPSGEFLVVAAKEINQGEKCILYNNDYEGTELEEKCEKNKHCTIITVDATGFSEEDSYKFSMCVPEYPLGADLSDGEDDNLCGMATLTVGKGACPVVYMKENRWADWGPVTNKGCEQLSFVNKMNNLCASMGDCGSYVNYVGEGSANARIKGEYGYKIDKDTEEETNERGEMHGCSHNSDTEGAECWGNERAGWAQYISRANKNYDLFAPTQDIEEVAEFIFGEDFVFDGDYSSCGNFPFVPGTVGMSLPEICLGNKAYRYLGGIAGAAGIVTATGLLGSGGSVAVFHGPLGGLFGATGFGVIAGGLGALVGAALSEQFGLDGISGLAATLGGGIAGVGLAFGGGPLGLGSSVGTVLGVGATVLFWIGIGAILLSFVVGGSKYETRYVEFYCEAWQPPAGGNAETCGVCNIDDNFPCTKYRCESLGASCQLAPENDNYQTQENPPCISVEYDPNPPRINLASVMEGYEITNANEGVSADIEKTSGVSECIDQGNTLFFTINNSKFAECQWSLTEPHDPHYDDMEGEYFIEGGMWKKTHSLDYIAPRVDSLDPNLFDITGNVGERVAQIKMFIKCKDTQVPALFTPESYEINFCIDEVDTDPVSQTLTKFNPSNGASIPYDTTTKQITMWTNEPAECKYDTVPGRTYPNMAGGSFECKNNYLDKEFFFTDGDAGIGWPCYVNMTNLTEGANSIYIRCKDQPRQNESDRKTNSDDLKYTLSVSRYPLLISEILFTSDEVTITDGETLYSGFEPMSVEVLVKTRAGVNNGISNCFWGVREGERLDQMRPWTSASTRHTTLFNSIMSGKRTLFFECEDLAGNIAKANASYTAEIDAEPPVIIRASHTGNFLQLITNEEAICYYDSVTCEKVENMTAISSNPNNPTFKTEHRVAWDPKTTYNIKCEDTYGGINQECAVFQASEIK